MHPPVNCTSSIAWERPTCGLQLVRFNPECTAKTSKNALRLALNLYVLWHRLDKALNQLTGPTPTALTESTMNMALTLHDTLLAFGGVAEANESSMTAKQVTLDKESHSLHTSGR
ncbi:hypothetical protein OS493_000897 [Desmophyllum pertusum]|uniref:Uncharacterized protein n=1 Tax=Desmophyllum pertusum TaxID=174260 RepID=A0A9W9ZX13_9CNID|nr:hypothetical protein OS493_000897 [Desmophyllum pertusum]